MKKNLAKILICASMIPLSKTETKAQITQLQDYKNYTSATIGTFQGISFREAGFSGLFPIAGTNGKEFWTVSDRGVNVDAANANSSSCRPTYDKIFAFPNYAPKIHRIRVNGDSIQILRTITIKRPGGTNASGVLNPTGFGSKSNEEASTDTVSNCANFSSKIAAKDIWSLDAEGIVVDKEGNFYVCEENGPTIWKINPNGVVIKRYSPYANLVGAQTLDVQIDTVFRYRKNNRGFEGMTITPNGKIYAIIQSPILYPTTSVGENTRIHRILEIDPVTNSQRMLVYLNEGIIGASGSNQIRLRDWKIGDMTAINDSTFLVIEAALRGTGDVRKIFKININNATAVNSGLYSGQTLEALVDSAGLVFQGITPVKKTLFMDLLANGWPVSLEKTEGIAIVNDSTVALVNDNDYGQVSPAENGIATATTTLTHLITYGLQGNNKLNGYQPPVINYFQGVSAISSSRDPYLVPTVPGAKFTAILSAGDVVNGYKMCGTPDGLGAFDNGNGTFTLLMNHEFGNTAGGTRAHGSTGAFVSKWVINKSDLSVVSGGDLIQTIKLWNAATSSYITYNGTFPSSSAALARFCSANLPAVSAYYNAATGKGTMERMFMNGEENGNDGRGFAHIATGPNAGTSYEVPRLGKFSWENSIACPLPSDTTLVAGTDDATPGQVYFYIGTKTNTGNEIEKAGLTNGNLYGVAVNGMITETNGTIPAAGTGFSLVNLGNVQNMTGTALNTASNNAGVTTFLRPEDGAWDPSNTSDFYFNTTNGFGSPSRLWKLHFTDISKPSLGGTITAVLAGTEGQEMLDNLDIDNGGHALIVEDVGGNVHNGKMWQYNINTDAFVQVARHDSTRFVNTPGVANFLTQDEEASGVIDAQEILGPGMFLLVDQAHYGISGEVVEGGQLLAFYNPDTYNSNPEVNVQGNSVSITDGDITPVTTDNTDFGNVKTGTTTTKTFVIQNTSTGNLAVSAIYFTGANASEFSITSPTTFPLSIAANSSQTITIQFAPGVDSVRTATMNIMTNDLTEGVYDIMVQGKGVSPEINIAGNNVSIMDGDPTPGTANFTDFGTVSTGSTKTRTFVVQNTGSGDLVISGITFTGTNASEFTLSGAPTFPLTIAGNGTQNITVQFAPLAAGIRTATIKFDSDDADEAAYDFALQGIAADPTGISNTTPAVASAKLYPNPTGGNANIAISLTKDDHVIVEVYDMQGRKVSSLANQNMRVGNHEFTLSTDGLSNGTYFVQIASGSGTTKMKLVVAH